MYKLRVDEMLNFGFYVHLNMRLQWFNIMTLTLGGLNVYRGFFFFFCYIKLHHSIYV